MSLRGRLLVALPDLRDPNFDRTVIYMIEHNDEGALGVVLNRPHAIPVGDILEAWAPVFGEAVLHGGGPVSTDTAICLAIVDPTLTTTAASTVEGVIATVDLSTDAAELAPHVSIARVWLGYAGWGPGQLEDEIEERAWYVCDALPSDVFTFDADGLWRAVLLRQHGEMRLLSAYPIDPRMN